MKSREPEDLIKYGLIPEFIGRMPIVAIKRVRWKFTIKILKEPKNSLLNNIKDFLSSKMWNEFSDEHSRDCKSNL